MELHDYIAGRRPWAQFERILRRLPPHSHYKAAIEDSDRLARISAAFHDAHKGSPPRVPLVGYDGINARLDNVFDALNLIQETMVALGTRKRPPVPHRASRPETAYQRLKRIQSMERLNSIAEKMTGGR